MKKYFTLFDKNHRFFSPGKKNRFISNHAPSNECEEIIKYFLEFEPMVKEDRYGSLYVGWGHSLFAEKNLVIDRSDAQTFLVYDLERVSKTVKKFVVRYWKKNPVLAGCYPEIPQSVFDALVVFGFFYGKSHLKDLISGKTGIDSYTLVNCAHDTVLEKLIGTLRRMYTGDGYAVLDTIWESDYEFFLNSYPFGIHRKHTEYLKKIILDPSCMKSE